MPGQKTFADWSDSRKERHIKYDQQNYSVLGCKLPRPVADQFREFCAARGVSVSSVLAAYVRRVLDDPESFQQGAGIGSGQQDEKPIDLSGD